MTARAFHAFAATVGGLAIAAGAVAIATGGWFTAHHLSPRVTRWARGSGTEVRVGRIGARLVGRGDQVMLFLSGIAASGEFWGADYDRFAVDSTVVFADPLGFGRSVAHSDDGLTFDVADHVDALRALLHGLALTGRPLTIVGHSMGGSLAIDLAAALDVPPRQVVAIGAPLYTSSVEADERVAGMGWFEALLAHGPRAEACVDGCARITTPRERSRSSSTRPSPHRSRVAACCTPGRRTAGVTTRSSPATPGNRR